MFVIFKSLVEVYLNFFWRKINQVLNDCYKQFFCIVFCKYYGLCIDNRVEKKVSKSLDNRNNFIGVLNIGIIRYRDLIEDWE